MHKPDHFFNRRGGREEGKKGRKERKERKEGRKYCNEHGFSKDKITIAQVLGDSSEKTVRF